MIAPFNFAATPQLHFGVGKLSVLPSLIKNIGKTVLLITGAKSFSHSPHGVSLLNQLQSQSDLIGQYIIDKEPTPQMIDEAVNKFQSSLPDVVVAVGGGSVLDAGKAISAMLPLNEKVKDYLEGVGTKTHPGIKIPFIAIPTTSGTGSEATKNAVLSEIGSHGYKRSLRHNNFVPDAAIIDPTLTVTCSPSTTATSGMDAFTQLLESYLSTASNPMTDAYALEGLKLVSRSLLKAYHDGSDLEARTDMSLAAYLSGVTLANAGLGLVHGFASSIGGYYDISHGVICSAMMAPCNKITVRKLREEKKNSMALKKYVDAGRIFIRTHDRSDDYYIDGLLATIESWTQELDIPSLKKFNIPKNEYEKIAGVTDNKNNPVKLDRDEIIEAVTMALEC
jgi:alcohol dehydrogenase class IV